MVYPLYQVSIGVPCALRGLLTTSGWWCSVAQYRPALLPKRRAPHCLTAGVKSASFASMSVFGLLSLLRPPNVFTALADSLAGVIVVVSLDVAVPARAWAVVAASGCLYLAGVVFNDVFDRHIDARERPTRPIPSGVVPLRVAVSLAVALMAAGVALAFAVDVGPGVLAVVLAGCVLLYDTVAKSTVVGPSVMGACRGLNMALGLSTGLALGARWPAIAIAGPLFLGLYVAGLTFLARDEVGGNTVRRARAGLVFLGILAIAAVITIAVSPGLPGSPWAWLWVAIALALSFRNWSPVWRHQDPASTGSAIGGGIVLIPILDAAVCAVAGEPLRAVAVAALTLPALVLKRFFSPT
jgi:4-hydroxybenzoate polyprenyltransferase